MKFNQGVRDIGRYWTFMDLTYSDIIKSNNTQKKVQSNYNKIIGMLKQLNKELKYLENIEMMNDEELTIKELLKQLAFVVSNENQNKNLNLTNLFDDSKNTAMTLIANQSQKTQKLYENFKQELKNAFLFNIDMQQQFHAGMPEFFDFISIRDKNGKTNLFLLDSKQLANFINNKDLVDFIPNINNKTKQITDFNLQLKRTKDNAENFDDKLLSYLRDSKNAYFLNNTVAEQAFNNNDTFNQFITKDKFYNNKLTKITKNTGQRTELMLQQLLNGKTVEEAYANGEGEMWHSTTRYTKTRNLARTVQVLNKDSEFGGAIGDSLGAIGLNKTTNEFTFLNNQYTKNLNMSNNNGFERIQGNFQIKALDLSNPMGTFSFGSASSILANNMLYTNEKNFNAAKEMYKNWVMADINNRAPKEYIKKSQYEKDVENAYTLAHQVARDFIFSFTDDFSNYDVKELDDIAQELGDELTDYLIDEYNNDLDFSLS